MLRFAQHLKAKAGARAPKVCKTAKLRFWGISELFTEKFGNSISISVPLYVTIRAYLVSFSGYSHIVAVIANSLYSVNALMMKVASSLSKFFMIFCEKTRMMELEDVQKV